MARLKISEDDLDNLTEEELAGMKELQAEEEAERKAGLEAAGEEDDEKPAAEADEKPDKEADKKAAKTDEDAEKPAEKPDAEADKEDDEAGREGEEGEEGDDGEAEGDEAEGEGEEGEGDDAGEGDDEKAPPVQPRALPYQITAQEAARLDAVEKELDAIAEKFDDGELTAKEMRDQSKALQAELDELKDKRTIAKMHAGDATNRWYGSTIPAFLADHTEYKKGTLRFDLLDNTVKALQAASTDPTDPAILVEAHKRIVAEFGEAAGAEPAKKTNGKKPAGNGRTIPPTLSGVPAAEISETSVKSEFGHLDKLKGEAYERAVAKLAPDARERYLMGG